LVVFGFVGIAGAPSIVCVNGIPFFLGVGVVGSLEYEPTIFVFERFYLAKLIYGLASSLA